MKYATATSALFGRIWKILNLFEILPVYLVERLYVSLADSVVFLRHCALYNLRTYKYCIFGQIQGSQQINCCTWKISGGEPQNLANWPVEFGKICGK